MVNAPKGRLILLMGPSGSGKNTLKAHIEAVFGSRLEYTVSYTTRAMRPGEVEGKTYHYISRDAFERMVQGGAFLEWAEYGGNYYGIPRADVEAGLQKGRVLFREIELRGYLQVKAQLSREQYSFIFIDGGDWEHLTKRILGRAPMSGEELALRRKSYESEMAVAHEADVTIRNEDGHVDEAKAAIEAAVRKIIEG